MPTVAQKLCSDIVNPLLEQSPHPTSSYFSQKKNLNNENTTRSVLIEKRKVINNIIPKGNTKVVVNKYKSHEIIYNKEFKDKGLNTIISGPLISNAACLTNIRQRNYRCNCEKRPETKNVCTSRIQLFCNADKECYHCSETISRGTQFLEHSKSNQLTSIPDFSKFHVNDIQRPRPTRTYRNPIYVDNFNPRRWELSKYPMRGPDF